MNNKVSQKDLEKALKEVKVEKDIRQCKVCSEYKTRIRDGKFPDGRQTKFTDENGRQWNGNTCSKCFLEVMKTQMKVSRKK